MFPLFSSEEEEEALVSFSDLAELQNYHFIEIDEKLTFTSHDYIEHSLW